jgi:hypothetical protein
MEVYIFALIAFVVLLPVLFFLHGGITKKGKIGIAAGALFISLLGLLALNQYSLLMVAIILFILVMVSSLVIGNRFGPQLLAEDGVQETSSSSEEENIEKEEKVLFSSMEEELAPIGTASEGTIHSEEEKISTQPEKDSQVEFISDEELEEIPLLTETETPENEPKDSSHLQKDEDVKDNLNESIQEELSAEHSSVEDLSELEKLILQGEHEDLVHNLEDENKLPGDEDTLEELPAMEVHENDQSALYEENMEPLSEIELMIHQAEEETISPEFEPQDDLINQDNLELAETDELKPIELPNTEIEFLENVLDEQDSELKVNSEKNVEVETNDRAEELLLEEGLSEKTKIENLEEEHEVILNEDFSEDGKLETDEMEESKPEEAVSEELIETEDQANEDGIYLQDEQPVKESEVHSPLQTRVIQTIIEELAYYRNKLPLGEFEAMVEQYLHPKLHDRDYFVLSQQLIQQYHELKEYKKLKLFIDEIEERFISYPILKSELNVYKEIAWKNIVKQQMM